MTRFVFYFIIPIIKLSFSSIKIFHFSCRVAKIEMPSRFFLKRILVGAFAFLILSDTARFKHDQCEEKNAICKKLRLNFATYVTVL